MTRATPRGEVLWEPDADRLSRARIVDFARRVGSRLGRAGVPGYAELWDWSVADLAGFWSEVWEYFGVSGERGPVVLEGSMPDSVWFPGTRVNYAENVLARVRADDALIGLSQTRAPVRMGGAELRGLVARLQAGLAALGVGPGDRVAGYLPNLPETVAAFLATVSLGAVWSSCPPEFGATAVLDRLGQISPKVLLGVDGYRYGARTVDRRAELAEIARQLRDLLAVVVLPYAGTGGVPGALEWSDLLKAESAATDPYFVPVGFSDPLYILYSSGTTGPPKPIVHGHGGILLEHLKALGLHGDLGPADRFFWFSTTGWMMWNLLLGGLLCGATIVAYDGSPLHPGPLALYEMAAEEKVTFFGTSAPFIETCRKSGLEPRSGLDLSSLRAVGSTGAPLSPEGFAWATRALSDDVLVGSASGGTDVCTAFLLACPLLPVYAGELQCAGLGAAVEAFDEEGRPVVGEVGELVITAPMPSMPIAFVGDQDGKRLHEAYFESYPGLWRHGDWVKKTARGTFVVYGRSDATLNRGGVRMGTSEFYRVVEAIDEVADSLVVDSSELGREGELILFLVPAEATGGPGLGELEALVRRRLRENVSPRHVPDRIIALPALPHTLNGKKVEVPIRRIILGTPVERALSADSLSDPAALEHLLAALRERGLI